MVITNQGTLNIGFYFDKPDEEKEKAYETIKGIFERVLNENFVDSTTKPGICLDGASIVFTEYPGTNLDDDIREALNDSMWPKGTRLDGVIEYWGDYDGYVVVKDRNAHEIDKEQYALTTCDEEMLIDQLIERFGYKKDTLFGITILGKETK